MRMAKRFPNEYNFFPKTYLLPSDYNEFASQFQGKLKTFIIKPEGSAQGRGIFLVQQPDQVPNGEHLIAQKYETKPYLLDGLKFDLRVYVLVAGCDPLRVYVYKEGLARFATSEYSAPNKKNLANTFMHLTNYAINKQNPEFKENALEGPEEAGHKQSLRHVFERMKKNGANVDELWRQIKLIAVKTLCIAQPQLAHCYRTAQPDEQHNQMCFELLGLDILVTSECKPLLLEVNHTPSFSTGSPLDTQVKSNCIADSLRLMRVSTDIRNKLVALEKKQRETRVFTGKRMKLDPSVRDFTLAELQKERDEFTRKNLGGFEEAYPCLEPFHQEPIELFLKAADEEYQITTGVLSKKDHLAQSPLRPTTSLEFHRNFSLSGIEERGDKPFTGYKNNPSLSLVVNEQSKQSTSAVDESKGPPKYTMNRIKSIEKVVSTASKAYHIMRPISVTTKKQGIQIKSTKLNDSDKYFKDGDEHSRSIHVPRLESNLDKLIANYSGLRLTEKKIIKNDSLNLNKSLPIGNIDVVGQSNVADEPQERRIHQSRTVIGAAITAGPQRRLDTGRENSQQAVAKSPEYDS